MKYLVLCLMTLSLAYAQDLDELTRKLEQESPKYLENYRVPGAGVAVIRNGKIVFSHGFGFADKGQQIAVTEKTGFNIGSISKTVAAWGLLKLVEEGKLDLDAPVSKYLTRWKIPPSEFNPDGVTLRRLLSHTAGLSLHGYPGFGPNDKLPSLPESLDGATNGSGPVRITTQPGEKMIYSGGGYTLAQLLLEEVTGRSFEDYMRDTIIRPLGMKNSDYSTTPEILKIRARAYDDWGNETAPPRFTALAAAGFHTTTADLAVFACAILPGPDGAAVGRGVLKPETIALMTSPAPNSPGYGLGYGISSEVATAKIVGHGGSNRGWEAEMSIIPSSGDGLILVTNGSNGALVNQRIRALWIEWLFGQKTEWREPIGIAMINTWEKEGIDAALAFYRKARSENSGRYSIDEGSLNNLGYNVMAQGKLGAAIALFKLNVEMYPNSSNPYDSLGEAYLAHGDKELALVNYQKAVELDPSNRNAAEIVAKLKAK